MKNIVFYVCILVLFGACGKKQRPVELKDLIFRCTVTEADEPRVRIVINGKEQVLNLDSNGFCEIKVPQIAPQYSSLMYKRKFYSIYLEGGEPVEMKISGVSDDWNREFSGGCKAMNEYLSSGIEPFDTDFFYKDEEKLSALTDELLNRNIEKLKKQSLPEDFVEMEKVRLNYYAHGRWYMYRNNHRWMAKEENFEPGDVYYKIMEEFAKEDTALYTLLPEYRNFLKTAVEVMAQKGVEKKTEGQAIREGMKYIDTYYKNAVIKSDLTHYIIYNYIKSTGVKGEEDVIAYYKQNVKDKGLLTEFDQLCFSWEHLQPGMDSPVFKYVNAKGDMISLESFRGKYVYIDLWASWCGPCRKEIPALKKLEKIFEGKDIVFVSISCDSNEEAWRQGMSEEKLTGIQLFVDGDNSFFESYLVNSIPRFILLDKAGKIVNANMTAPSKPETEEFIRTLPDFI